MTNVVDLDARRPHRVGHLRCTACGYSGAVGVVLASLAPPFECARCGRMSAIWSGGKRHVRWDHALERWVERQFNYVAEWWHVPGFGWARITLETSIRERGDGSTGSARA